MVKLGVIFGGRSGEHEVSLMSATSVLKALPKDKYEIITIGITRQGQWLLYHGDFEQIETGEWEKTAVPLNIGTLKEMIDFALPILHGPYGEDGTIQGFFEMMDLPYGGCGVLGSALAMDKGMAKEIFRQAGLPICRHQLVLREQFEADPEAMIGQISQQLGYPVFVKPANLGSSVGITKARDKEELKTALVEAAGYDRRILVEAAVNCREIETGVIGNGDPQVAVVGEILPSAEFYDYTAKYFDGGKSQLCVPALLDTELAEQIRTIAKKAYLALDCAGYARVDFFIEKETNGIYLNELNTIPGFTKASMFPLLWEAAGVPYSELLERIIEYGYERYNAKNHR